MTTLQKIDTLIRKINTMPDVPEKNAIDLIGASGKNLDPINSEWFLNNP